MAALTATALLAHPDDELMCAGTLAKLVDEGYHVRLIIGFFSDFGPDHKHQGLSSERFGELDRSVEAIGVELVPLLAFNESEFDWSQQWVQRFEMIVGEVPPDILISHRVADTNHSHSYLGQVARTLTRRNQWPLWECDQALPGGLEPDAPAPNMLVDITDQIERKDAAVAAYRSQLARYPGMADAIKSRDRLNGWQMQMTTVPRYAEAFRVHKTLWR